MVKLGWETYSVGADIFGATAFLLTFFGSMRCDFIKFTSVDGTFTDHFGVWRYGQWAYLTNGEQAWLYEGCFPYADSVVIDSNWKAARAFDAMVLIGGLLFFMISAFSACLGKRTYTRPNGIVGVCLLLLSLFSGLTLLVLDSNLCKNNVLLGEMMQQFVFNNDQCELSTGANCFISATVFWFAAALCSLSASRSKNEKNDEVDGGLTESLIQGEP